MGHDTRRFAGLLRRLPLCPMLLGPVLLVAACAPTGQQRTARLLDDRLQTQMAPDIAAGRAVLQPSADGAQVTLLGASPFSNKVDALDDRKNDPRAGLIEGLLDPTLMQLQVVDTSGLSDKQRLARVGNVMQYFTAYGLGGSLRQADPLASNLAPSPAAPKGIVVTISVHCPDYHDGSGYSSGQRKPACY